LTEVSGLSIRSVKELVLAIQRSLSCYRVITTYGRGEAKERVEFERKRRRSGFNAENAEEERRGRRAEGRNV